MTPSFHILFDQVVGELRSNYQPALKEPARRAAFDSLLDQAWIPEQQAMMHSFLPSVIDHLNMAANVDNRRIIMELFKKLGELEIEVEALKADREV